MFIFRRFKFIILAIHCLSIFKSSIFWIHNSKFWFCTGFGSWITSIPKVLYVDLISPYGFVQGFCMGAWNCDLRPYRLIWFLKDQQCEKDCFDFWNYRFVVSVTFFAFFTWYMWLLLLLFLHIGEWIKFHLFVMTYSKRTLVVMVRRDSQ